MAITVATVLMVLSILCVTTCLPAAWPIFEGGNPNASPSAAPTSSAGAGEVQRAATGVRALHKRFVNPSLTLGYFSQNTFPKIRTRRSAASECEKLELCKLHARAHRNFFAAFELYFVNKENAKLWDHRQHSFSDCVQRFSCPEYRR